MSGIDEYFLALRVLGDICERRGEAIHLCLSDLSTDKHQETLDLIKMRASLLSPADKESVKGLLATGLFADLPCEWRVAGLRLSLELEDLVSERRLRERLAKYEASQPLFREFPELVDQVKGHHDDLLPSTVAREWLGNGVCKRGRKYLRIEPYLPPHVADWLRSAFGGVQYLRFDPTFVSDKPRELLLEEVLVPANPKWWSGLSLRVNEMDAPVYQLNEQVDLISDPDQYTEYHIKKIRRLEVVADRRDHNYLSMMVEELAARGASRFSIMRQRLRTCCDRLAQRPESLARIPTVG